MSTRILIGDDSPVDCLAIALTLNRAGHTETEVARSGADIRERLRTRQFDVIVLDYHLDDGVSDPVLRLAETRQRKAQILMVSGDAQLSGFAHRLSPRVIGFVHKVPGYAQTLAQHMVAAAAEPRRRDRLMHTRPMERSSGRHARHPAIGVVAPKAATWLLPLHLHLQEG